MNKILIIGANSLLGVEIIKKEKKSEIYVIVNKQKDRIPKYCSVILFEELGNHTFNKVYLLASNIPYGNFSKVTDILIKTNIELPLNLLSKIKCNRILYASSVAVYGDKTSIDSKTMTVPNNAYGFSKLVGEEIVKRHFSFGIVRFPSLFGEGMGTNSFIGRLIEQTKKGEILIFGSGQRVQNYLHYADAAQMLYNLSNLKESKVVLGIHPDSFSNIELAEIAQKQVDGVSILNKGEDNTNSVEYKYNESLSLMKSSNFTSVIDFLKKVL